MEVIWGSLRGVWVERMCPLSHNLAYVSCALVFLSRASLATARVVDVMCTIGDAAAGEQFGAFEDSVARCFSRKINKSSRCNASTFGRLVLFLQFQCAAVAMLRQRGSSDAATARQ